MLKAKIYKNVRTAVPLKNLSNSWKIFNIKSSYEIGQYYVICEAVRKITFAMIDIKLYFLVVTPLSQDNAKLL